LVPQYLRFVKGVVDSADLPLNVSRETLQHNALLGKIKNNVVNRVLKTLEEMKDGEYETYVKFFKEFGAYLKEGVGQDWSNRERLADLLLFESLKTPKGEYTSLAKYLAAMPVGQNEIHYLVGESREMLENSPYLESFKANNQDVLLLTEPIDEYLASSLMQYKDKPLKAADRGESKPDESNKEQAERFKPLLESLKTKLTGEVKDVRLSGRLKESAAVLVADEGAMSAHMERLLQRMGRGEETTPTARILELNPDHASVKLIQSIQERDANDPRIETLGRLLLDQAVIAEGSRIKDPAGFARRVNELMSLLNITAPSAPQST
jgi:molecular chaperone HtpG